MDEENKGLFTVAEAAAEWGVSIQTVYKRLKKLKQEGLTGLKDGKPCFTTENIEAYRGKDGQNIKPGEKEGLILKQEVESLKTSLNALQAELQEERGKTSTLQATVTAQEAHINSLQAALDKAQTTINQEQAIRMASLQKRLPTPGRGFFAWLRGKKDE